MSQYSLRKISASWPATTYQSISQQVSTSNHWTALAIITLSIAVGVVGAMHIVIYAHPYNFIWQLVSCALGALVGYYATPKPISPALDDHELKVLQLIAFGHVVSHSIYLTLTIAKWVTYNPILTLLIISIVIVFTGLCHFLFGPRDSIA